MRNAVFLLTIVVQITTILCGFAGYVGAVCEWVLGAVDRVMRGAMFAWRGGDPRGAVF